MTCTCVTVSPGLFVFVYDAAEHPKRLRRIGSDFTNDMSYLNHPGSVFIGTEESRVPQSVKDKIINANGLDLLLFRTLPDYYRSLPGKLADKLVSMDKAGASNEELAQTMGGLRGLRIGMLEGNTDEGYIALGTGIGNIRSIKSVAEVVNELAIC